MNDEKKKDVLYIFTGYYYKNNKIINSQKNELCLSKVCFYRVSESQERWSNFQIYFLGSIKNVDELLCKLEPDISVLDCNSSRTAVRNIEQCISVITEVYYIKDILFECN